MLHPGLDAIVLEPKWLSPSFQGDNLVFYTPLQAVVVLSVVNITKQQRSVRTRVCVSACVCLCCSCRQRRVVCLPAPPHCCVTWKGYFDRRFRAESILIPDFHPHWGVERICISHKWWRLITKSFILADATAPRCSENKSLWWWALWFPGNQGVASLVVNGNRLLSDIRGCVTWTTAGERSKILGR